MYPRPVCPTLVGGGRLKEARVSVDDLVWELSAKLPAERIMLPGSPAFEQVRVWNAAVPNRAALVVRPYDRTEARDLVRAAVAHRVPLSVLGGGHDWAGRALRPGGMVIDMSTQRWVVVDPAGMTANVGGGAIAADVLGATERHGLVAATGLISTVGFTGLTIGGGYGPLGGVAGLGVDNMLQAEVVLADGRLVPAERDTELWWALRGGGGNLGLVTSMRVRLHPYARLLAGFFRYPYAQATEVLHGLAELVADAPDELTIASGVLPVDGAGPTLFIAPVWSGDPATGHSHLRAAAEIGSPIAAHTGPLPYLAMLRQLDASIVPGRGYTLTTRTVAALTPEVIAALVEAGASRTSPAATVIIHHMHGAASRVPVESTAFGIRRDHLVIEAIGGWDRGDPHPERQQVWADRVSAALAPHSLPGGYPNLLGPDHHDQIAAGYGPNAARLAAAKRAYDPDGVFSAIPLPPG
jgi:FAD/FMN-containing dehydrogenase